MSIEEIPYALHEITIVPKIPIGKTAYYAYYPGDYLTPKKERKYLITRFKVSGYKIKYCHTDCIKPYYKLSYIGIGTKYEIIKAEMKDIRMTRKEWEKELGKENIIK